MSKKKEPYQVCTITIKPSEKAGKIDIKLQWDPPLDRNDKKNNPSVVAVALRMMETLK